MGYCSHIPYLWCYLVNYSWRRNKCNSKQSLINSSFANVGFCQGETKQCLWTPCSNKADSDENNISFSLFMWCKNRAGYRNLFIFTPSAYLALQKKGILGRCGSTYKVLGYNSNCSAWLCKPQYIRQKIDTTESKWGGSKCILPPQMLTESWLWSNRDMGDMGQPDPKQT